MVITSKQRATLRAQANKLTPAVHMGHQGMTDSFNKSLDDALRTQELVKIQFSRTGDADIKQAANELAHALGADVVQVIGRTATLYRERPAAEEAPARAKAPRS